MPLKERTIVGYRKYVLVCFFISIPFTIFGMLLRVVFMSIVGLTMITAAIITSFLFWRCPSCKRRLPMKINAKDANNDIDGHYVCPHCNTKFSSNI